MTATDLSSFDNSDYRPGNPLARLLWYITSLLFFTHGFFPFMTPKRVLLRLFGASVGKGLIIKPNVNIKYPWRLTIGNHVWLGERVWIDSLDDVYIGDHVCISQGAMLECGNHDYTRPGFDLQTRAIRIEQGSWIGARSFVGPGVTVGSHAVLSVGSVTTKDLDANYIYRGNPAVKVRERIISER